MIRAYWFFGDTLRTGAPIPADGEWLQVEGELILCEWGLHASLDPWDALQYAPGPNLALVELAGQMVYGDDKLCAQRRRILARIDATDILRTHARESALSVIDLWDAPAIVRQYLTTGDESLRQAAEAAAWADARSAAGSAAWSAAGSAAWSAARAAAWADARSAAGSAAWSAAGSAAWSAARAAAGSAAWAAAGSAAWSAAGSAARDRFRAAVAAKFSAMGVQP